MLQKNRRADYPAAPTLWPARHSKDLRCSATKRRRTTPIRGVQIRTDRRDSPDNSNPPQSSHKAVLDSGSTRFALGKASEQFHNDTPNLRFYEVLFDPQLRQTKNGLDTVKDVP